MENNENEIVPESINKTNKGNNSKLKKAIKSKLIKKIILKSLKPLLEIFIVICIAALILAPILNFLNLYDGTKQDEEWSNLPYVSDLSENGIEIEKNGTIRTGMSAEEMWNLLKENDSRVDKYLDKPEELKKLLYAELITQYLDTRPNPDAPINRKDLYKNPGLDKLQGITKLKRTMSNGENITMVYVDPETFQANIDKYNETGLEEDKQKALRYFTIEREYSLGDIGKTGHKYEYKNGTDGEYKLIDIESAEPGDIIEVPEGYGYGKTYTYIAWQMIGAGDQLKLIKQAGMTFDDEGFGRINGRYAVALTPKFGHVGDYIDYYYIDSNGEEKVIPCIMVDVKGQDTEHEWGHHGGRNMLEFYVNGDTWTTGYPNYGAKHKNPGEGDFKKEWVGTASKIVNGGSYFDNPDFVSNKITEDDIEELQNVSVLNGKEIKIADTNNGVEIKGSDESMENGLMHWPCDSTHVSSKFGLRKPPTKGASSNHRGIDIGDVPRGGNIYATEAGKVILAGWNGTAGFEVRVDHGNGYVSRYLHNSKILVTAGEMVEKGQLISLAGDTGEDPETKEKICDGVHLHFEIQYKGMPIDPLKFKYENGMGEGNIGIGNDPNGEYGEILAAQSYFGEDGGVMPGKYYAKVATWTETTKTLESNDPNETPSNTIEYKMESTNVDFLSLLTPFTMPLEYLWDFLLVGQEKEFVLELADLVYESEIDLTVIDNLIVDTTVTTDTYTEKIDVTTTATVSATFQDLVIVESDEPSEDEEEPQVKQEWISGSETRSSGPLTGVVTNDYTTINTVVVKTNTIEAVVTKANIWIVDFLKGVALGQAPDEENITDKDLEDIIGKEPQEEGSDLANLAENFRQEVHAGLASMHDRVTTTIESFQCLGVHSKINRHKNINNLVQSTNNVALPATIIEKTDPNSIEPNFITIYRKMEHTPSTNRIHSAQKWLLDMISKNPETADMVDLTEYLLKKASEEDFVGEFDVEIFDPDSFSDTGVGGSTGNIGGINNENIWEYIEDKEETFTTEAEKFLWAADQVHTYQMKDWTYGTNYLWYNNIERSINNPGKKTCCATFVGHVLYLSGFLSEEQMNSFNYNFPEAMHKYFRDTLGWEQINLYTDLEPGDIVFMNYRNGGVADDHVQIYAGSQTWYNAGSTYAIKRASPYEDTIKPRQNFYVAYRPKPMI